MVQFAEEGELLERLVRELREPDGKLLFLVGPDLAEGDELWPADLVRVAGEYADLRRNDDLRRELLRPGPEDDPTARFTGYRRAIHDWLGAEEFDVVLQRTVLKAYRPPDGSPVPEPSPARPLDHQAALELEQDPHRWRVSPGMLALGRLIAHFPDRLGRRIVTTALGPGAEVALGQLGVATRPVTPYPSLALIDADARQAVQVLHLLGYWRPLRRDDRLAPLPELRQSPPQGLTERLHALFAGATVCVLGYRGSDPIVFEALQSAMTESTRVLWAVPDRHAERDARIRILGDRLGGGDALTIHCGVAADLLLQKLAVQFALVPEVDDPLPRRAPAPVPRTVEQPELARSLGAVPLRAPAKVAADLLRQLGDRFEWRLERGASPAPTLLFWPVRLRPPSVIHMVQALTAAALSARGVRVVLALDDFGQPAVAMRGAFEDRVNEWFGRIAGSQRPDVHSVREWIDNQERQSRRVLERPTRPWAVLQEYYGRRKPNAYDALRAAKIVPDVDPDEAPEQAVQIVKELVSRGAQRLLTAPALWALFNHLLIGRRVTQVMTLAGDDERTLWRHWYQVTGEETRHLYHPRIANLSQDSGLIRWVHHRDLRDSMLREVGQDNWRRTDRYLPWLVRHAFLLPEYLRTGGGAQLDGQSFDAWQDVLNVLETSPGLADVLAKRISEWFLSESD